MTHVQIKTEGPLGSVGRLIVDGVDLSMTVLREGLRVEFPADIDDPVRVHCVIAADVLDVDLPDALLVATKAPETEAS